MLLPLAPAAAMPLVGWLLIRARMRAARPFLEALGPRIGARPVGLGGLAPHVLGRYDGAEAGVEVDGRLWWTLPDLVVRLRAAEAAPLRLLAVPKGRFLVASRRGTLGLAPVPWPALLGRADVRADGLEAALALLRDPDFHEALETLLRKGFTVSLNSGEWVARRAPFGRRESPADAERALEGLRALGRAGQSVSGPTNSAPPPASK